MPTPISNFEVLLRTFVEHGVEFITVGGVSAVLQGAPINTFDLDLVHARTPQNLERLFKALQVLDAYYREQADRRLRPSLSHLASAGHQLLMTTAGPLDLLGTVSTDRSYEDLLPHSIVVQVGEGLTVRVLDLASVISLKEEAGWDKDKSVLPILRRTLEEKNAARQGG